jgi:UDP-N-acetylmuramoyl-L-alanyl-D-glutamate--2,6-diaminopimelate ligase
MGLDIENIKNSLVNVKVVGRIEPVICDKLKVPVIIDYAHNAVSLNSLFEAVKAYNPNRIICVFGCGGNRSKLRRYEMGEVSGKYADLSIITSDNSRFEELDDIISDILIGMHKTNGKYEIIPDRKDAIFRAIDIAKKGDIILLAGKGQETYLDIKGVKTHFDEREVVLSYFKQ